MAVVVFAAVTLAVEVQEGVEGVSKWLVESVGDKRGEKAVKRQEVAEMDRVNVELWERCPHTCVAFRGGFKGGGQCTTPTPTPHHLFLLVQRV